MEQRAQSLKSYNIGMGMCIFVQCVKGSSSLKIKCGPWKVLEKSLKMVPIFVWNLDLSITLTHLPWRFCWKTRFETSRVVCWSLSCYKELKLTTNLFTGRTWLHGLLIQMQNISLRSSRIRRKQNSILGLKVTQQSWLLLFTFSPSLFFRFSCLIFFFSCWAFSRLHFGGKSF